mmetsp:Transcript_39182/g.92020  ORF Transcript_39182/g.92020 Transcript_39182/m.92020 type:complete len:206 (-) Transcript_39182:4422-5039(-)
MTAALISPFLRYPSADSIKSAGALVLQAEIAMLMTSKGKILCLPTNPLTFFTPTPSCSISTAENRMLRICNTSNDRRRCKKLQKDLLAHNTTYCSNGSPEIGLDEPTPSSGRFRQRRDARRRHPIVAAGGAVQGLIEGSPPSLGTTFVMSSAARSSTEPPQLARLTIASGRSTPLPAADNGLRARVEPTRAGRWREGSARWQKRC